MDQKQSKMNKLRKLQETEDKHVLIYVVNDVLQEEESLSDSYFIGKGNKLVSSLLEAEHFDNENLAEKAKKDDTVIVAPLNLFIENEMYLLKKTKD